MKVDGNQNIRIQIEEYQANLRRIWTKQIQLSNEIENILDMDPKTYSHLIISFGGVTVQSMPSPVNMYDKIWVIKDCNGDLLDQPHNQEIVNLVLKTLTIKNPKVVR
jgi:hypothetical protein